MAEVRLENIAKVFDGTPAVRGITLAIAAAELVVLVGPSGCGKTTTLRMIAGLEQPSAGAIVIAGRRVEGVAPGERDVAMVFQSYALYPHMTVFQNMAFGLRNRGVTRKEIRARVGEAARTLGIEGLLGRRPRQLSGGERQRVAMGRAIVRRPAVFLFDEPLSNLDARLRVEMRIEIKRLQRALATTTVYVTHDQVEAMTLADRIVVMNQGAIEQAGPPEVLYHHPATRFVAGFIGSPAMNLVAARLSADGRAIVLGEGARLALPEDRRPRYAGHAGRPVVFGLRPEHLGLGDGGLRARVDVVEPLGSETHVYVRTNDAELCARLAPETAPRPGETVMLAPDLAHMHLFDPESGRAI